MIKRLGIFGGAFDPVHKGHTQSLKYISDLKIIDEIQVIPNYASPHNKEIQTDEKHRLKMLEIAFKEIKNIKLNDIELKNKTKSYTYETLKHLKEIYPEQHLSLIIGLDSLHSFTTWKNWENILSLCSLLVLERKLNDSLGLNKEFESKMSTNYDDFFSGHGKILILKNDLINISSTDVRQKIIQNSLEEIKAQNTIFLDLSKLNSFTDFLVITSGTSSRHMSAIKDKLLEDLKNNKISISGVEGQNSSEWILLDLGDFVINIMSKDSRALYDLESLWDPALN